MLEEFSFLLTQTTVLTSITYQLPSLTVNHVLIFSMTRKQSDQRMLNRGSEFVVPKYISVRAVVRKAGIVHFVTSKGRLTCKETKKGKINFRMRFENLKYII